MKALVMGSAGFIGANVADFLEQKHEVVRGTRSNVDLTSKQSVLDLLQKTQPDAVVNCAGVVDASKDVSLNVTFTRTILEAIAESGLFIRRVVIMGSAGEYGLVDPADLPISEDAPLAPISDYARSKRDEVMFARQFAKEHAISLAVARVFNPLGVSMNPKFLTSRVIRQLGEIKAGERRQIEVNRLDATRDYIDIRDVASGIGALVEGELHYDVYNVGSGQATANGQLIDMLLEDLNINPKPPIVETSPTPEPSVASQADITRMYNELGWKPTYSINDTVKEIANATK